VEALQKAGLLREGATLEQAVDCLRKACWLDQIAIVWTTQDVLDHARSLKIKLAKTKAQEVLDQILNRHDASQGVSWDTLEYYIRQVAGK
jgi:hypothetical protein